MRRRADSLATETDGEPGASPCARSCKPSFVAEKILSLHETPHFYRFPEGINNCADGPQEDRPAGLHMIWSWSGPGEIRFICARHISSPLESETTLGCIAADRAAVESPDMPA